MMEDDYSNTFDKQRDKLNEESKQRVSRGEEKRASRQAQRDARKAERLQLLRLRLKEGTLKNDLKTSNRALDQEVFMIYPLTHTNLRQEMKQELILICPKQGFKKSLVILVVMLLVIAMIHLMQLYV